MPRTVR